jgi:hypothetical protein
MSLEDAALERWLASYPLVSRVDQVQVLQKLSAFWADVVARRLDDYWSQDVIKVLRLSRLEQEDSKHFWHALRGVAKNRAHLIRIIGWRAIKWIRDVLDELARHQSELQLHELMRAVEKVEHEYNQANEQQ